MLCCSVEIPSPERMDLVPKARGFAAETDSEEPKDDSVAALVLASLKHSKLDQETTAHLQALKCEVLGQIQFNPACKRQPKLQLGKKSDLLTPIPGAFEEPSLVRHPEFGTSIDGVVLPRLPPVECLNDLIGRCSRPFEKQLTASDVNDHQNRLALHYDDVKYAILPLLNAEDDIRGGISVTTYDWEGNDYPMRFKIWYPHTIVLVGQWKKFFQEHGLRANQDWVTVHVQTDELCFVITSRRLPTYAPIKRHGNGVKKQGRMIKGLQHQKTKKSKDRDIWSSK